MMVNMMVLSSRCRASTSLPASWYSLWYHSKRLKTCGSRMLVCGDGDLSFSASISRQLADQDIHLTASVLESRTDHRDGECV